MSIWEVVELILNELLTLRRKSTSDLEKLNRCSKNHKWALKFDNSQSWLKTALITSTFTHIDEAELQITCDTEKDKQLKKKK